MSTKIQTIIDSLTILQKEGYTELNITISDGYNSVDAEGIYFNEGTLTDGTKVVDLDITTTLMFSHEIEEQNEHKYKH